MSGGLNSKLPAAKAPENTRCKFSKLKCSCKSAGIFTGAIAWRGLIHWQICFTSSTWYLPSHCPGIYDVRCDVPVFPIYGDVSYKQHSLQVFEGYLPGCGPEFAKYNVICQVYQEFGTWWHEALFDDHLLIQIIWKLNFFQWFCHLTKDSQVAST